MSSAPPEKHLWFPILRANPVRRCRLDEGKTGRYFVVVAPVCTLQGKGVVRRAAFTRLRRSCRTPTSSFASRGSTVFRLRAKIPAESPLFPLAHFPSQRPLATFPSRFPFSSSPVPWPRVELASQQVVLKSLDLRHAFDPRLSRRVLPDEQLSALRGPPVPSCEFGLFGGAYDALSGDCLLSLVADLVKNSGHFYLCFRPLKPVSAIAECLNKSI